MEKRKRTAVRIRPKQPRTAGGDSATHRFAVFTALDGTLLDSRTFDAGPAAGTLQRLHAAGIPLIPVSVMTLEEIAPLAADLGMQRLMIIEAGGAIARWTGAGWDVEPCGPPAVTLLDVVSEIEDRAGANLIVYSALPAPEAGQLSGRTGDMLEASTHRCFSEPFIVESGDLDAITKAAADLGFSVRRGKRFLYLCRECDRGEAFTRVREEVGCEIAIALGGSALDAEFLSRADIPIIVPGPDGLPDPELLAEVPHARIAPGPGPEGWAAAVNEVWQHLVSPHRVAPAVTSSRPAAR